MVVHPSNQFLYTTDFSSASVSAFRIDPANGALTAIGSIATAELPGSMAIHPSGRFLYITCAAKPGTSVVQAYAIDINTGALSPLGSPVSPQAIPSSIVMDPFGRFVYFVSNGIEAFVVDPSGTLTRIQGSSFPASFFGQLVMAPGGTFLYGLDASANAVSVLKIDRTTGALSAIPGSPFAAGSNPVWMSVSPTGRFLLVADPGSLVNDDGADTIGVYAVDAVTGALAPIAGSPFAAQGPNTPDVIAINAFYNAALDHYFITWVPDEIAKLDGGVVIKGWTRTGQSFRTYTTPQSGTSPVCRYYIPPGLGDSRFFGRGTVECDATGQQNPSFVLEAPAFMQMFLPASGVCPATTTQIYRVFSNRPDANHRYLD